MAGQCALDLPRETELRCSLCFAACDRFGVGRPPGAGEDDLYRDNTPGDDRKVRCKGCGLAFPGRAALRAAGLDRYPRLCRDCRGDERPSVAPGATR